MLRPHTISEEQFDDYLSLASDQPGMLASDAEIHEQEWDDLLTHRNACRAAQRDLRASTSGRAMTDDERNTLRVLNALIEDTQAEVDLRDSLNDRGPRASAGRGRQTDMGTSDPPGASLRHFGGNGRHRSQGGDGRSIGERIVAGFKPHAEMFERVGSVAFDIPLGPNDGRLLAAATDPIVTGEVGTTVSIPGAAPSAAVIGIQNVLPSRVVSSATTFSYPRYASVSNAAGVQTEGSAKTAVKAAFTLVTQAALTVAAYSKLTTQAMEDAGELEAVANGVLRRAVGLETDIVLTDGSGAWVGFEAIAGAVTSGVYEGIADAVSEEVAAMQIAGFNPTVVVMNPSTWLAAVVARGALNDHYLSGNYLGSLPMSMRGLQVGLSAQVAAEKALIMDVAFCEYLISSGMRVQVGLDGSDFTSNLVTMRAEIRIVPVFRVVGAARLVTPKAPGG